MISGANSPGVAGVMGMGFTVSVNDGRGARIVVSDGLTTGLGDVEKDMVGGGEGEVVDGWVKMSPVEVA